MDNLRVLVVDDNTDQLMIISNALSAANITYMTISDSTLVLQAIDKFRPTIVIMDQEMPNITGTQLVREIKLNPATRDIKIIFLSAHCSIDDILKGVRLQVVDYLTKPTPIKTLLEHILIIDLETAINQETETFKQDLRFMSRKYDTQHCLRH